MKNDHYSLYLLCEQIKNHAFTLPAPWKHPAKPRDIPAPRLAKLLQFLCAQGVPGSPLTTCAWICVLLSDLLSSGESVYTNPKSSAIKEAGAEQLQALLNSASQSSCSSDSRACWDHLNLCLLHPPNLLSSARTSSLCQKGSCRMEAAPVPLSCDLSWRWSCQWERRWSSNNPDGCKRRKL